MRSWRLPAYAGRSCPVSCGCEVVIAVERSIDVGMEGATFEMSPPGLVLVPCGAGREHLALARALDGEGGMRVPEDLAAAMEEALSG